jgi:uncharacterized Tic20 family protein
MSTGEPLAQSSEERMWGMLCHLTALSGFLTGGLGFILGPLIVWLIKKDQFRFVNDQGKESLNIQISMMIYSIISGLLIIIGIGVVFLLAIVVVEIVLPIMASIAANEGKYYKYPLTMRFLN